MGQLGKVHAKKKGLPLLNEQEKIDAWNAAAAHFAQGGTVFLLSCIGTLDSVQPLIDEGIPAMADRGFPSSAGASVVAGDEWVLTITRA